MFCLPRTVQCGLCNTTLTEKNYGDGFTGWVQIMGLIHDKDRNKDNPMICEQCKEKLIKCMNELEKIK